MYFTTDLSQLEEDLQKSITVFEFDAENNKYRLVEKDLEILKRGSGDNVHITKLNQDKFNSNVIVE